MKYNEDKILKEEKELYGTKEEMDPLGDLEKVVYG